MNSYLSRDEKTSLVRLEVLAISQEAVLEIYQNIKSTDGEFLKCLRTSQTWLKKAIAKRKSFLSEDAKLDFIMQAARLKIIFVPSDIAKKEYAELKDLSENFIMPIADFEDWYAEVIEYACKTCSRADWEKCKMHCLMTKYGVYPVNPDVKIKCPYSYVDADPSKLPSPCLPREVAEEVHDEAEILPAKSEIVQEDVQVAPEQIAPSTVPVEIYLASGVQLALEVPQHMAEQLFKGMKGLPKHNRPVCACHVSEELIAVDTQEVAVFRARGIGECELERSNNPMGNQNALPSRNTPAGNKNAVPRESKACFKIECKCGADYFCQLSSNSPKARCRDCGAPVYTDWEIKDVFPGTGEEATLMTNRYFVEQKGTGKEPEWKKKEISGPTLGQYREPCKIFE